MPWFQRRRAVAEQEQRRLWRLARMKTDMRQITSQMNELEAVDSFNAIEKHIIEEVKVCYSPFDSKYHVHVTSVRDSFI